MTNAQTFTVYMPRETWRGISAAQLDAIRAVCCLTPADKSGTRFFALGLLPKAKPKR